MNGLYPIPKRQRKPGAFPTADALRAAKSLQTATASVVLAASVPLDSTLPTVALVVEPGKNPKSKKSHDDAADK